MFLRFVINFFIFDESVYDLWCNCLWFSLDTMMCNYVSHEIFVAHLKGELGGIEFHDVLSQS